MNLEILCLPGTPPRIPQMEPSHVPQDLKYIWIYKWKKWKKPVGSYDCRLLREQSWFTRLCECIINYLHIITNSWWCRNPAPVEINSVNKDIFTACLQYIYLPYSTGAGFPKPSPVCIQKKESNHGTVFVCVPKIAQATWFCIPKQDKERKKILQSKKIWLIFKTPSSCCLDNFGVFPNLSLVWVHWGSTTGHHHP